MTIQNRKGINYWLQMISMFNFIEMYFLHNIWYNARSTYVAIFTEIQPHKFKDFNLWMYYRYSMYEHLMDPICNRISENFYTITQERAFFHLKPVDIKSLLMNINLSVLVHGIPVIHPEVEILKLVGLYLSKKCTSTDKFIFISNDFMSTGFNWKKALSWVIA
jgi:hypothetical protein